MANEGGNKLCCFCCKLLESGIPVSVIREICSNWFPTEDYVTITRKGQQDIVNILNMEEREKVKSAASELLAVYGAGNIPVLHCRYYQHQIVKSGFQELDQRLPDGGFVAGKIYVVQESSSKQLTETLLHSLLTNSQTKLTAPDIIEGMESNFFRKALVINTSPGSPLYFECTYLETSGVTLFPISPKGPIRSRSLGGIAKDFYGQIRMGLVIVDCIRPIVTDKVTGQENPLISQWIKRLHHLFSSLGDVITVLVASPSAFPNLKPGQDILELAVDDNDYNVVKIRMPVNTTAIWTVEEIESARPMNS